MGAAKEPASESPWIFFAAEAMVLRLNRRAARDEGVDVSDSTPGVLPRYLYQAGKQRCQNIRATRKYRQLITMVPLRASQNAFPFNAELKGNRGTNKSVETRPRSTCHWSRGRKCWEARDGVYA